MKTVTLFLALALTAVAADSPPSLSRLFQVEVPADSAAEFYAVQREIADIYKTNQAPISRIAWTSLTGEPRFYTMVPLSGLDKLDERTWLSQQGEERPRQARQARLRKATGPSTTKIFALQKEPTWDPTPQGAPEAFGTVSIYSVKSGKVADFLALMKEATEVTKKIGKAKCVYVNRLSYGGDSYEFVVFTGYDSLADISTGAFRAAMGDAAYKTYFEKMGATIQSVRRDIIRFRPEFSYLPPAK
jgi:hypothetical protein